MFWSVFVRFRSETSGYRGEGETGDTTMHTRHVHYTTVRSATRSGATPDSDRWSLFSEQSFVRPESGAARLGKENRTRPCLSPFAVGAGPIRSSFFVAKKKKRGLYTGNIIGESRTFRSAESRWYWCSPIGQGCSDRRQATGNTGSDNTKTRVFIISRRES